MKYTEVEMDGSAADGGHFDLPLCPDRDEIYRYQGTKEKDMMDHGKIAEELFMKGYNCAQAVFCAFTDVTGYDIDTSARMASSFGGGLGRLRETCGALSAAALVLGIARGYDDPTDPEAKKAHYELVRDLAARFRSRNGSIRCLELLTIAGLTPSVGGDPEPRSEDFYQRRPCPSLVADAARILDEMLDQP